MVKDQRKGVHDLPMQISMAVYAYTNLRMLELWEFVSTFLVNNMYQFMEMDTDSLYCMTPLISASNLNSGINGTRKNGNGSALKIQQV